MNENISPKIKQENWKISKNKNWEKFCLTQVLLLSRKYF